MKMNSGTVFFCLFLTVLSVQAQEEVILWSDSYRLSWQDFKGAPDANSDAAAVTASGISYEFNATVKGGEVLVDYKVNSYFYPQKSWYNKQLGDAQVLRHEQLHFNITELHTRKMRTILSRMKFTDNVRKEIKTVYEATLKDLQQMQKQYDSETDYSRNPEMQKQWEAKVALLLKEP
ncbi:DUF922 domain-containing protein [Flavobacteriaceae bacterium M23B6Z8]